MSPTDLLNRPKRGASGAAKDAGPEPRSLPTNALLAGILAATITLVIAMAISVIGWFLADAGAHGDTTDALRTGTDIWLVGHGTHLEVSGVSIGLWPLGLTLALMSATFRAGRWAGQTAEPVESDRLRAVGLSATMLAGAYGVVAIIVCVLASVAGAAPSLGRACVMPALLAFMGGGLGLLAGTGEVSAVRDRLPARLRLVSYGALVGALGLVAAAAAVLAGSLLVNYDEAATVLSKLHLSTGDALAFTLLLALFAPNFVLLAAAYLVGPGFAFGTGTSVTPTSVDLGALPALPVLAAIPAEGRAPGWLLLVMLVPLVCGALGARAAQRRQPGRAYDQAALNGAAVGFGAGVVVTLAVSFAGGALGTGRLADIGAPFFELLLVAGGGMGLGGLIGGLATAWWQRRGEASASH